MSTAPTEIATTNGELTDYPEFALNCLVDDETHPHEVTIFAPASTDITTHWITSNIDAAVSLDDVR